MEDPNKQVQPDETDPTLDSKETDLDGAVGGAGFMYFKDSPIVGVTQAADPKLKTER